MSLAGENSKITGLVGDLSIAFYPLHKLGQGGIFKVFFIILRYLFPVLCIKNFAHIDNQIVVKRNFYSQACFRAILFRHAVPFFLRENDIRMVKDEKAFPQMVNFDGLGRRSHNPIFLDACFFIGVFFYLGFSNLHDEAFSKGGIIAFLVMIKA